MAATVMVVLQKQQKGCLSPAGLCNADFSFNVVGDERMLNLPMQNRISYSSADHVLGAAGYLIHCFDGVLRRGGLKPLQQFLGSCCLVEINFASHHEDSSSINK
ncbi:uncharacterized protein LOC131231453 [Magnolia sinica]|uniref:uncharacterized protein LOC131231453 n=1 Tax=Magnolia sinica TaxID=86752 RepID=UPI00265A81F1|nr:uncharacterized protein LOC131231453 [Magnolia sinica]